MNLGSSPSLPANPENPAHAGFFLAVGHAAALQNGLWMEARGDIFRGHSLIYFVALSATNTHLMKPNIHPTYNDVIFVDVSCDFSFLTRSTMKSKETMKWTDGKEYPVIKFEISSKSHPFYTGKHKVMDAGGRVDKFKKRYAR